MKSIYLYKCKYYICVVCTCGPKKQYYVIMHSGNKPNLSASNIRPEDKRNSKRYYYHGMRSGIANDDG